MHPFTQHHVQCRHVSRLSQLRGYTGARAVRWLSQLSQAVYLSVSIPAACASPLRLVPLRAVLWVNGVRNDLPAVPAYQASESLYGAVRWWLLVRISGVTDDAELARAVRCTLQQQQAWSPEVGILV